MLGTGFENNPPIYDGYKISGLLGLTGSKSGLLTGSHILQTGVYYHRQIQKINKNKAFLGCSVEAANIWLEKDSINTGDLLYTYTAYTAVETTIGPFYFGFSYTEGFGEALFLSTGSIF